MSDEKPALNVVEFDPSGIDIEILLKDVRAVIEDGQLESVAIVGIGRRQAIATVYCNLPYDPVRLLGAIDLARTQVDQVAAELMGLTQNDSVG